MKYSIAKAMYILLGCLCLGVFILEAREPDSRHFYANDAITLSNARFFSGADGAYFYVPRQLMQLGDSLYRRNRKKEAGLIYQKALPYILLYRPEQAAELYLNMGNTAEHKSRAMANFRLALAYTVPSRQGRNIRAKVQTNIANILIYNGSYSKALLYLDSSITLFAEQRDSLNCAIALINRGNVYNFKEQKNKAIASYRLAEQLLTNNLTQQFLHFRSRAIYNLAGLYLDERKSDSAHFYLRQIQSVLHLVSDEERLIHYYLTGYVCMAQKKYRDAERHIMFSLEEGQRKGYKDIVFHSNYALTNLYHQIKDYEKAWYYGRRYFDQKDTSFEQIKININRVNHLESDYALAQKNKAIAEKQFLIARQEKNLAQKNLWLLGTISIASIVTLLAFITVKNYRRKQKLLQKDQEIITLKALMAGEENERQRLSRELHDGIGGMLAAIKFKVGHIRKKSKEMEIMAQLQEVMEMLQDTGTEVRTTSHNLLPDMLNRYPLKEALVAYFSKLNNSSQVEMDLQLPEKLSALDKTAELVIFRIVQELVHNAARHAAARRIDVQLLEYNEELILLVEDDGKGFDPDRKTGYGLENLKYRVRSLGGTINIDSAPDRGSAVRITFNLVRLKDAAL